MYQIFGLARYLRYFCLAAAIIVGAIVAVQNGPVTGVFRIASGVVSVLLILVFVLGETPAFPWLCRKTPLGRIFPDIDGDWQVELESNWPTIAAREGISLPAQAPADKKLSGKISIKARFFAVHIKLDMDSKYSKSRTLFVKVEKGRDDTLTLHYIYENTTLNPLETDSGKHYGAANLELIQNPDNSLILEGEYWTNRNWKVARNTAGVITLRR